jgi:hypothetical protein
MTNTPSPTTGEKMLALLPLRPENRRKRMRYYQPDPEVEAPPCEPTVPEALAPPLTFESVYDDATKVIDVCADRYADENHAILNKDNLVSEGLAKLAELKCHRRHVAERLACSRAGAPSQTGLLIFSAQEHA